VSSAVRLGEGLDRSADGGEAVLAGGAEVFQEAEGGEGIGGAGGDFGGRGVGEEFAEEGDEAFDEWAFGVAAEMTAAVAEFADEPDLGDAAGNAVGVGALGFGQGFETAGAIDDGGEALLRVFDQEEIFDELLLAGGERHGVSIRRRGSGRRVGAR